MLNAKLKRVLKNFDVRPFGRSLQKVKEKINKKLNLVESLVTSNSMSIEV